MSRISYSDEEDRPGQFALWQANCARSMQGRKGQAALRELEAALVAMPVKELIAHSFVKAGGAVCALGAVAVRRKIAEGQTESDAVAVLSTPDGDEEIDEDDYGDGSDMEEIGVAMGFPRLVAWKIVEQNDIHLDTVWERHHGPIQDRHASYQGGIAFVRDMTPAERHEKMLAWVRRQLKATP